jgi:hypothetical protein
MRNTALRKKRNFVLFAILGISFASSAGLHAAENKCSKDFYAEITSELSKAYVKLGKPKITINNLRVIKDVVVHRLESRSSTWPKGASFSLSVYDDAISVEALCQDKTSKGIWTPDTK